MMAITLQLTRHRTRTAVLLYSIAISALGRYAA